MKRSKDIALIDKKGIDFNLSLFYVGMNHSELLVKAGSSIDDKEVGWCYVSLILCRCLRTYHAGKRKDEAFIARMVRNEFGSHS